MLRSKCSVCLCFRTSGGRLHLVPDVGKIPMADAILIEDPSECAQNEEDGKNLHIYIHIFKL